MKYKVGDKVRVKMDLKEGNNYKIFVCDSMEKLAGCVVIITRVRDDAYKIKEDGEVFYWSEDMFEGKIAFTKSDLKNGDIVTRRDSKKMILLEGMKVFRRLDDYGNLHIINYTDDLKDKDGDTEYDIMSVERATSYETLFKREEKKEMTTAEMAEKIEQLEKVIKEISERIED